MKRSIIVCDDVSPRADAWRQGLATITSLADYDLRVLSGDDFAAGVETLRARRRQARDAQGNAADEETPFDDALILFLDYDLFEFSQATDTGEAVAYLARCYSHCGLIVDLNQFGDNIFDLTLDPHLYSFADVHLGSEQLRNTGLWGTEWPLFRPWSWPLLLDAATALEARAIQLQEHLDDGIFEFLGFPTSMSAMFPRAMTDFLDGQETFRGFVERSTNALRPKDKAIDDGAIARIAAARIAKWLEGLVLSGQEILVDAPHLVSRYPGLLSGDYAEETTWNTLARIDLLASDLPMRTEELEPYRFKCENWLSRPAWIWEEAVRQGVVQTYMESREAPDVDLVFCEDTSRFHPLSEVTAFEATLPTTFSRRYFNESAGLSVDVEYRQKRRVSI